MNRRATVRVGIGVAVVLGLAVAVEAQHEHAHQPGNAEGHEISHTDARESLRLSPTAAAGLKLTMREHLEAIRSIVAAMGQEDFEKAAKIAHEELGFPKHHQAMEREAGATFPPTYHELAMAHHQEAEDLAQALPSKDLKMILPQLEKTIGACVSCHRAYKL